MKRILFGAVLVFTLGAGFFTSIDVIGMSITCMTCAVVCILAVIDL